MGNPKLAYFVVLFILIGVEALSTGQLKDLSRGLSSCLRRSYVGMPFGSDSPFTYPDNRVDDGFDSHADPSGDAK